jgi:copper chaperone
MKAVDLTIEDMLCESCAKKIEVLLRAEPGVKAATVSYAARRARVMFDPAAVDVAALVKAVERAGYRVPQRA